jgi:adenylate kinase
VKNFIILGPPGSGKDTQIDELIKFMDLQLISGGDISRSIAKNNAKYAKIIEEGGLLQDDIILTEIGKTLETLDKSEGVVFDGFPRTLHQAEALNEILLHHGRNLDKVVYIELEEGEIVDRLSRRRVCSLCGHNATGSEKCGICGGRAVRRPDDEPAVIIKRVQTFLENTLPLVAYYRNKGILVQINGAQSIAAVAKDIREGLVNEVK